MDGSSCFAEDLIVNGKVAVFGTGNGGKAAARGDGVLLKKAGLCKAFHIGGVGNEAEGTIRIHRDGIGLDMHIVNFVPLRGG